MPTTDVESIVPLQSPRVVKCPTPQCPGWITLDSTRHQTEPCRYCRISVDTLRFLLSRVGAENKLLSARVHDEFNRLMLTVAGAAGQNVYLRASGETLVDLKGGARGVIVEYNPQLGAAGSEGAAPLVGIILHKLLHFEAHLGHRPVQVVAKSGARDKEVLTPLMGYLAIVSDHAWMVARLKQIDQSLYDAQSRWGLGLAQMMVGSERMLINYYLSERTLGKLVAALHATADAQEFRAAVLERLVALTRQMLDREREELRKLCLAIQLANIRLLNPEVYQSYTDLLISADLSNVRDAQSMADRLAATISDSPFSALHLAKGSQDGASETATTDPSEYHEMLESAIRALGMGNFFELKS